MNPTIDLDAVRSLVTSSLPPQVRWHARGVPVDFDFSWAAAPLRDPSEWDLFLLNSNIEAFVGTFLMLDGALRSQRMTVAELEPALRGLDPECFERSDWRRFSEFLLRAPGE